MAASVEKYKKLLKQLLPQGWAWREVKGDAIGFFQGIAEEFSRIEDRGSDLLRELDPGESVELLSDWEELLGLPDECTPENPTLSERQQQARQKLAAQGGISAAFYVTLAEQLGFPGTIIRDYHSFRVGRQAVGDPLSNPFDPARDYFRVGENTVGQVLKRHGWQFTFEANLPADAIVYFSVGQNTVGEPLVFYGNEVLECTFKKLKPAHTSVFFTFQI